MGSSELHWGAVMGSEGHGGLWVVLWALRGTGGPRGHWGALGGS